MKSLDHQALRNACYDLARAIRWKQNSVDKVIASALVEPYYQEAIEHEQYLLEQDCDPNVITRAVKYLSIKHAIPPLGEDIARFRDMLHVLIELVCPNCAATPDMEEFFQDVETGINVARQDYAS
jgi:hypothetical protein